jgi:hypothetical protein
MSFFKTLLIGAVMITGVVHASDSQATLKNSSKCEFQKVYSKVSGYDKTQYPEIMAKGSEHLFQFVSPDLLGASYKAHVRYDIMCDHVDSGELVVFNIPSDQKTMALCVYSKEVQLSSKRQCDILIDPKNSDTKLIELQDN